MTKTSGVAITIKNKETGELEGKENVDTVTQDKDNRVEILYTDGEKETLDNHSLVEASSEWT